MGSPRKVRRRPGRLQSFDYATPGAYFITVCTWDLQVILGEVVGERVLLSDAGRIVEGTLSALPVHYPEIGLDAFVVMPNHVHGIIILEVVGAGLRPAPTDPTGNHAQRHALPEIIRAFKSFSARGINELRRTPGHPVWQRGYYDHVIREEQDLKRIRDYIFSNPLAWSTDRQNPLQSGSDPFEDWLAKQGRIPALKSRL